MQCVLTPELTEGPYYIANEKVHVGGRVVHTGQAFFPEALTAQAYKAAPYSSRPGPDVTNAQDSIYVNGGRYGMLHAAKRGAGYVGSIAMGVHR